MGSPAEGWGSGRAWGGAWGLDGWRKRKGASQAGVPRAAGGRRAKPGPAAAAEPGAGPAPPPPRRDVSGATLKGAGRPPRVGAGVGGAWEARALGGGYTAGLGDSEEAPASIPETEPQKPKRNEETLGLPEGTCEALRFGPSKHTGIGTPFDQPAPSRDYISHQY